MQVLELSNTNNFNASLDIPFTIAELLSSQAKLKNQKAVGIDLIPNEILKSDKISELLLHFVNFCFMNAIVPSLWQQAIIKPIPKSSAKDPYIPLNYRGISLLSSIYKLYSSMLNTRLSFLPAK